jgi:GxxExxY protein
MADLIYKDLSYKLAGLAFEIYSTLGGELKEKVYGNAFEELLKRENISFSRELYYPVKINKKVIGKNFFDFMVDDKVVVELKKGSLNYIQACNQLSDYLKSSNYKLGLIIRFTKDGARVKRIVNII